MTVLSEVDSVSRLIGRDSPTDCFPITGGAEIAGPPDCVGGCCGPPSPEAVGSAGPPDGELCAAGGTGTACCSQITGGSKYFFSATLSENFCELNFWVLSKFENQHCHGGSATAEIT